MALMTGIKRRALLAGAAGLPLGWLAWTLSRGPRPPVPIPAPRLGINLSRPVDWNTELPFVDVFRLSREWISQRRGADWGGGPPLSIDRSGWVQRVEPDCWAETLLCNVDAGRYPSGRYSVYYDGSGEIAFGGGGVTIVNSGPGRLDIDVDSTHGALRLQIRATEPSNYIRNIRVMLPGSALIEPDQFNPSFLERWAGVACIRFMDWMATNDSRVATWAQRPVQSDATYTARGVPIETMLTLANRLRADPWFCIPHLADDDYVRELAALAAGAADPERRIWIELSNEIWNGTFEQSSHAAVLGMQQGLASRRREATARYVAARSMRVFEIWEEVFGGTERLVRVLPSQAASIDYSRSLLTYEDSYARADVLAIAPYISCNIAPSGQPSVSEVERWDVGDAIEYLQRESLPGAIDAIRAQKNVADRFGLRLVAYEAGQHMVGINGAENNDAITALCHATNADAGMGDIYRRYYEAWTGIGGDLLCHYSSVANWNESGSWGLARFADERPSSYEKFAATLEWARSRGQPMA